MGLLGNTNKKTYILILFMFLILLLVGSLFYSVREGLTTGDSFDMILNLIVSKS
jgi:high-affinity Fe2+/Pb2+ permease